MASSIKYLASGIYGSNKIAYSTDGITWTGSTSAASVFSQVVYATAHNGIIWVAGSEGNPALAYSYDGITWTSSTSGNSVLTMCGCVTYGNGMFIAVGKGSSYSIAYSYDGINWTGCASNTFFGGNSLNYGYCVTYKNNMYVAGGSGGGPAPGGALIGYSSNGIDWTLSSSNTLYLIVSAIDYNGTTWVAVGTNTTNTQNVVYSSNAITWSSASYNAFTVPRSLKWNGTTFLSGGNSLTKLMSSTNGSSWSTSANLANLASSGIEALNYVSSLGMWLGGQYGTTGTASTPLLYSYDGTTWTARAFPYTGTTRGISIGLPAPIPCFLQGSKILRMNVETDAEEYVPVETLRRGDLIKTAESGYKAIQLIGYKTIENRPDSDIKSRLFIFKKSGQMTEDLCVTGEHCALHKSLAAAKLEQIRDYMGDIYVTEGYYRVPAHLDENAEPYPVEGEATIWHFALEHDDVHWNYGVFANGLLVESCSVRKMAEFSDMSIL